jgi:hypothetical protein
MNAEELQHIDYLAATRLTEIGYRRYLKEKTKLLGSQPAKEARQAIKQFIDRWEARELTIAHMVRCAPLYTKLQ